MFLIFCYLLGVVFLISDFLEKLKTLNFILLTLLNFLFIIEFFISFFEFTSLRILIFLIFLFLNFYVKSSPNSKYPKASEKNYFGQSNHGVFFSI